MLAGLRELDFKVTLLSLECAGTRPWDREAINGLTALGVDDVRLYQRTPVDDWLGQQISRYHRRIRRRRLPLTSRTHTPGRARRWFARQFEAIAPEAVMMVYAHWDGLLAGVDRRSARLLLDTIDLTTLNRLMWEAVERALPPGGALPAEDDPVLDERFFARQVLLPADEEFAVYDRYDHTIAISAQEADIIAARTRRTCVTHLPMTMPPVWLDNTYDGATVFPTGPNPFNFQGYCYLVQRVLPAIRKDSPDFTVAVTGEGSQAFPTAPGVTRLGFLPELAPLYARAPFLLCPVFGGTGQLVKVLEAMAHGVPAVVLAAAAARTPIRHGEDGWIAADADEMAEGCRRLWHDRALCRQLGEAARERVAAEFGRDRLQRGLEALVGRA